MWENLKWGLIFVLIPCQLFLLCSHLSPFFPPSSTESCAVGAFILYLKTPGSLLLKCKGRAIWGIIFKSTGSFCLHLTPAIILKQSRTWKSYQKLTLVCLIFSSPNNGILLPVFQFQRENHFSCKRQDLAVKKHATHKGSAYSVCKPTHSARYTRTIP